MAKPGKIQAATRPAAATTTPMASHFVSNFLGPLRFATAFAAAARLSCCILRARTRLKICSFITWFKALHFNMLCRRHVVQYACLSPYRYLWEITDCRQLQLQHSLHSAYKLMHVLCATSGNRNERCKCSDPVEILGAHCRAWLQCA